MVAEADLVKKIQELKKIRPRKDWVVLTKSQILGEEDRGWASISFFPFFKPALATVTAFGILFGVFGFAQNALPGDTLYSIKKITEKGRAVFVSEKELPKYNLEIANKRLDELNEIAQTNQVKKLAPAIGEYQASISQAAKNLTQIKEPKQALEIGEKIIELKQNVEKIRSLGVVTDGTEELEKEYENTACRIIGQEIESMEKRTLTEKQDKLLPEIKEDYQTGNCSQALEKLLLNQ